MRTALPVLLAMASVLAGCATVPPEQMLPADAVTATRTEGNGDVVTEYRVQGQLRMVKVVPVRGPAYYLVDRDGDGHMDPAKGEVPTTWFKLFSW